MEQLVILDLNTNELNGGALNKAFNYSYDNIINFLISGYKLRYTYPNSDIYCRLNKHIQNSIPNLRYLLNNIYDGIIETNKNIKKTGYNNIKYIDITQINNNIDDTNYIYHNLKKHIGPNITNSFMFREHDILIQQGGGVNFENKKIVYNDKKNNPLIKIISNLYNVSPKLIINKYSDYYHINTNTQYRHFKLKSMLDDIKPFDYMTPIKTLFKCNSKNKYYQKIINKYDGKKYTKRLDIYDNIDTNTREFIITQYIKCRPKTFMITLWMSEQIDIDKFVKLLEKNGNIYYVKTLPVSLKALKNIMFCQYDEYTYSSRLKYINKKLKDMKIIDNNNEITIILFDNVHNKDISDRKSKFKQYLRKELTKLSNTNISKDNLLHINDYFYQTVELTKLLFNKNSLDILDKHNCDKIIDNKMIVSNVKLQTYRHILYKNFSLLEQDRIICNSLDNYNKTNKTFTDIYISSTDSNIDSFYNKINELFNSKNIYFIKHNKSNNNNILDPTKYYYLYGIKFIKK